LSERICLSFQDTGVDGDNPQHVQWIYEQALKRSEDYDIKGVTYRLTQGTPGKLFKTMHFV
jgi:ubiquitin-activating enzyme E1 C